MATTTMVHVRVDEKIKAQATETLAAIGLSVSPFKVIDSPFKS